MKFAPKFIFALAAAASIAGFASSASAHDGQGRWGDRPQRHHDVQMRDYRHFARFHHEHDRYRGDHYRGDQYRGDAGRHSPAIAREDHGDAHRDGGYDRSAGQHRLNAGEDGRGRGNLR